MFEWPEYVELLKEMNERQIKAVYDHNITVFCLNNDHCCVKLYSLYCDTLYVSKWPHIFNNFLIGYTYFCTALYFYPFFLVVKIITSAYEIKKYSEVEKINSQS